MVIEPEASRDHTEKMLRYFGASIESRTFEREGRKITLEGRPELRPRRSPCPADPSSAAFPLVAAPIVPGSDIIVEGDDDEPVAHRPARPPCLKWARISRFSIARDEGGEEVADLRVRAAPLKGVDVPAERAPSDDRRISDSRRRGGLCVRARRACAACSELRVKESDRLEAVARGLARRRASTPRSSATISSSRARRRRRRRRPRRDASRPSHRDELSRALGSPRRSPMAIDDAGMIATSFPAFRADDGAPRGAIFMIIAIDGPAASGKGTLARRLAAHFGLPHLDTGLLYRATARALLDHGQDLSDRAAAISAARSLALTDFDEAQLRGRDMAEAASVVAAIAGGARGA